MTNLLVLAPVPPESRAGEPLALTPAQARLRKMVLDAVPSPHSKRNYGKALDDLFAFCASRPLSRSLLMEWRAGMESLSPSTINVRLSAGAQAGRARPANGMLGSEEAASLTDSVNAAERSLIETSLGGARSARTHSVPWRQILRSSTLWTLSVMYFCYAYCISVYLDWFPTYLNEHRGFDLKQMGFYASLPLLAGTAGDLLGGWLSDRWAKRSGNLKMARRGVAVSGFLLAAAAILPATFTASPTASRLVHLPRGFRAGD